jgi:hypothetical protein
VRVLISLSQARKDKSHCEQGKRWDPCSQDLSEDLEGSAQGKKDTELEILCEIAVGQGSDEPATERSSVTRCVSTCM